VFNETQSQSSGWEKRAFPRTELKAEATLSFGDISVGCTVRNISGSGVVVFLPKWQDIPDDVNFALVGDEMVRPAVVVRRLAPNIALHFRHAMV
jgi:hypothetical protein